MSDLTPKQEAFALAFVETRNATEAYRRAYDVASDSRDAWLYVEACQLLDHPKVSLRIEELQAQAARHSLFTVKQANDELEEARVLAIASGAPAAAVSATTAKIKLFGLDRPRRVEVTGADGGPIEMSARDALSDAVARLAARSGSQGNSGGAD